MKFLKIFILVVIVGLGAVIAIVGIVCSDTFVAPRVAP
jgi:hypothetical protein